MTYTRNDGGLITSQSGTLPLNPTIPSSTVTGTYNHADGISKWGADNYTYDTDGNLTGITGSKTFSAAYDNENRPTSITLGGITTTYIYDGLGNRVKAETATTTRNFHHDPWGRLLFETNASGQVTTNYIYAGNRLIASGTIADGYVYYHQDKTGNTLALTDSSGAVVGAFAYSPYGAVLNKSGAANTPYTYVGAYGVMDEGNGLYFMKNRYYDAGTGRFLQRDPIGFAGGQSNLYAYVSGNPVTEIDPSGLRGRDFLKRRADALEEQAQPILGDITAVGNLTYGTASVIIGIGTILFTPGAVTIWTGVAIILGTTRIVGVIDNNKEYQKKNYDLEDAALSVIDPTRFIRNSYDRAPRRDQKTVTETVSAVWKCKMK